VEAFAVNKSLILAPALTLLVLVSPALGQTPSKPVARADYLKSVDARFNGIDSNHDGKLTKDELMAEQQRELERAKAGLQQEMQLKFKQLDTNKDGQLNLQEFLAAAPAIRATVGADQLLQQLDANHDGKVTADEFRAPEVAKFSKVDANHDGVVTADEVRAAAGKK
jgi:Ca2+-binding EF-hand superfamily protein